MAGKPLLALIQRKRSGLASRALYGGMSVNSKDYNAGQFLPGRRMYAHEPETPSMPPDLNHKHLKSLDLHKVEPTWSKHARNKYGGVIFNPHGHVLMVEPANHWAGYTWTFPKGGADAHEHPVDTALREVKEETGHDTAILGLVPKGFTSTSGSGHIHYFVMRSHGQTSEPNFETASTRWSSPEDAHKMIDKSTNRSGRARDHEVLDAAVNHFKLLHSNPEINDRFRRPAQRMLYEKHFSPCDGHCGCEKCSSHKLAREDILTRIRSKSSSHSIPIA